MRLLKLLVGTILGFGLFFGGLAALIVGASDGRIALAAAGAAALAVLGTGVAMLLRRSSREARAERAGQQAKQLAGLRTCHRCSADFAEATAVKTPKPWAHTALLMLVALVPLAFGGAFLWALLAAGDPASAETWAKAWKALVIVLAGVAIMIHAIRSTRDLDVRCPTCGRACGSATAAPAG